MSKMDDIHKILELAEEGDDEAQKVIGENYYNGFSLEKNDILAIYWLMKSARKGNKTASNFLKANFPKKSITHRPLNLLIDLWYEANNGNDDAQLGLGLFYLQELEEKLSIRYRKLRGVPLDNIEAEFWFEKAYQSLNMDATYNLAKIKLGNGETKKAIDLFTLAATNEHSKSQLELGRIYLLASYVKRDIKTALEWLIKAGNNGEEEAMFLLFDSYFKGEGVEKNYDVAIFWLTKASMVNKSYYSCFYSVSEMYFYGIDTDVDYKKAQFYLTLTAENEFQYDRRAKFVLGSELLNGERFPQDIKKAITWLSESGPDGWDVIGYSYWYGEHLEENKDRGLYWMIKANAYFDDLSAETLDLIYRTHDLETLDNPNILNLWKQAKSNDVEAQYELAKYFEKNPLIDDLDYNFLISWYENAANKGHTEAEYEAARINFSGVLGEFNDIENALHWCESAANNGHVNAQYELGMYYLFNEELFEDDDNRRKGLVWLEKAAENNNYDAMIKLSELYKNGLWDKNNSYKIIKVNNDKYLFWLNKINSTKNGE